VHGRRSTSLLKCWIKNTDEACDGAVESRENVIKGPEEWKEDVSQAESRPALMEALERHSPHDVADATRKIT
jgi:hypothetical protein